MKSDIAIQLILRSRLEASPVCTTTRRPQSTFSRNGCGRPRQTLPQLKQELLLRTLEQTCDPGLCKRLCGAANQAADQAWGTPQPLLTFPGLFQHLVQSIRSRPTLAMANAKEIAG